MSRPLPEDYALKASPPSLEAYLNLRARSGLSPRTQEQALAAMNGAWCAFHVVYLPTSETVGMGRALGDGGWYFHIIDMAVLPGHQKKGLGDAILRAILEKIRSEAPPGPVVNLLADPPGVRLYKRHGFVVTAPAEVGMSLKLKSQA